MFNPIIQGWINYYSRYYKSALYLTLKCLERRLIMWATRKYKRLRNHRRRVQTVKDNVQKFTPEILDEINQIVVHAGQSLKKKKR